MQMLNMLHSIAVRSVTSVLRVHSFYRLAGKSSVAISRTNVLGTVNIGRDRNGKLNIHLDINMDIRIQF